MTGEQLQTMHQARPFQPFDIHPADGRSVRVKHPEMLAYVPGRRTFIIAKADETHEVIDLLLVSSLETVNGRRRGDRRR